MTNVVYVRHDNGRVYLYDAHKANLKEGEAIIVDNAKGKTDGVCFTDSFWVEDDALRAICKTCGAKLPLAKVIGRYVIEAFA